MSKYLHEATRNELIEELKSRKSITFIPVGDKEGATINTPHISLSISGTNIFAIDAEEKENE